jgi:hypothetical protein
MKIKADAARQQRIASAAGRLRGVGHIALLAVASAALMACEGLENRESAAADSPMAEWEAAEPILPDAGGDEPPALQDCDIGQLPAIAKIIAELRVLVASGALTPDDAATELQVMAEDHFASNPVPVRIIGGDFACAFDRAHISHSSARALNVLEQWAAANSNVSKQRRTSRIPGA